nr:hypothetical protein [uncultured Carboxylicivirga sp.]
MNKTICIIIITFLSLSYSLKSQELYYSGPLNSALADVKSLDQSIWAAFNNPSTLSNVHNFGLGASYQTRFNIKELSTRAVCGFWSGDMGAVSGIVLQSGYSKSLLNRYAVAYSRKFGASTSAFVQFNYISHQIELSENTNSFYSALGLHQKISSQIFLGILISNPEQATIKYGELAYNLPSNFIVGLLWTNNDWIKVFAEAEKELDNSPVFKGAVEFALNDFLLIRAGIKGEPVEFTFGSGFNWPRLNVDLGFRYHQQLGFTSSAGISYLFTKTEQ